MSTVLVDMPADAARVWADRYQDNLDIAGVKMELGHRAYERATCDDAALMTAAFTSLVQQTKQDLDPTSMQTAVSQLVRREAETYKQLLETAMGQQKEMVIQQFQALKDLRGAQKKQTANGNHSEVLLVERINAMHGFRAQTLNEKNEQGFFGGDIVCSDAHGNSMVIEVKDKSAITVADLTKFDRDVNDWSGVEKMFCFMVKNGIGSSRKLIEKPEVVLTASCKVIFWFRETDQEFVERLPYMMAYGARMLQCGGNDADLNTLKQAVQQGLTALRQTVTDMQKHEAMLSKEISAVQKRKAALEAVVRSMETAQPVAVPTTKKRKVSNVAAAAAAAVKPEPEADMTLKQELETAAVAALQSCS
jgi:hypothetical protein